MARKIKIDNALLKRYAQESAKRQSDTKLKRKFILIVCEGEKTEPNYFESIRKNLKKGLLEVEIQGLGRNTLDVVEEADRLRHKYKSEKNRIYDEVWAVFDKDSFLTANFDNAINKGESLKENIFCAWTNEAFELWYLLHFEFVNVPMNREDFKPFIEKQISAKSGKPFKYLKNSEEMYQLLLEYGDETQAIKWAETLEKLYTDKKYSTHNPCTMVHKLVSRLYQIKEEYR